VIAVAMGPESGLSSQRERAAHFRCLHKSGDPLLLGNAWDAGSALILERLGYRAVGTTSAGIAFSRGLPDHGLVSPAAHFELGHQLASLLKVPVNLDLESALDLEGDALSKLIEEVLRTGVAGVNVEDSIAGLDLQFIAPGRQVERILTIRDTVRHLKGDLVINARVDSLWLNPAATDDDFQDLLSRAKAYRDAGADCIFAPGLVREDWILELIQSVGCPVNLLFSPVGPNLERLASLGVRRISQGSSLVRSVYSSFHYMAARFLSNGTVGPLLDESTLSYSQMNDLFIDARTRQQ